MAEHDLDNDVAGVAAAVHGALDDFVKLLKNDDFLGVIRAVIQLLEPLEHQLVGLALGVLQPVVGLADFFKIRTAAQILHHEDDRLGGQAEQLGLSVKRLQMRHHRALNAALAQHGITLVQWDALRHLDENPDASLHDLAQLTFQSDQAFGTLAGRMIDRGLIERVPGPGRAVRHRLTAKGRTLRRAGDRLADQVLTASFAAFSPDNVAPAALYLVSEDAPTNMIIGAGAGAYHAAYVTMTKGALLPQGERTPEGVAAHWAEITDRSGETVPQSGAEQSMAILKLLQGG